MKKERIILVLNGQLPKKNDLIKLLKGYDQIICVDGGANKVINCKIKPTFILGDLDSINKQHINRYKEKIVELNDQRYNDLSKTLEWLKNKNILELDIIGIDGKRADHSLNNFYIIFDYIKYFNIKIITEYGNFYTVNKKKKFKNCKNKTISIFNIFKENRITTYGLKYELKNKKLKNISEGCLNIALNNEIEIIVDEKVLIFIEK